MSDFSISSFSDINRQKTLPVSSYENNASQNTSFIANIENNKFKDSFYNNIWNNQTSKQAFLLGVSPIICLRRIMSIPDKIKNGDYYGALGLIATMGILAPEDFRDIVAAFKQIIGKSKKTYNPKEYQVPFSFIRGSLLEPIINKMGKLGYYLHKYDKTFYDSIFGQKIKDGFKLNEEEKFKTDRKVSKIFKDRMTGKYYNDIYSPKAIKLEGTSKLGKFICRMNQRITRYGVIMLGLASLPSIIKAFNKGNDSNEKIINGGKQTIKSAVGITASVIGIGLCGALLSVFGPAGSVIGMGLGAFVSYNVADLINRNIKTN